MRERFLFDQEFDENGRPRPKSRAETFGEDDLVAARAQAFADGQASGMQDASGSLEASAAHALEQISAQLADVSAEFQNFAATWKGEAAAIAAAVGRKMADRLLSEHPMAEIEAMVIDCVNDLHEEPRLVIRASTPVSEAIAERLDQISATTGFNGHLVVLPDETMSDQDCRIEWANGGVERNAATTEAAINRAISAFTSAGSSERNQHNV